MQGTLFFLIFIRLEPFFANCLFGHEKSQLFFEDVLARRQNVVIKTAVGPAGLPRGL
jgi:hypothetical protein